MPLPLAHATIAFDLDGTLIDTAPDLVGALNAVLTSIGLEALPLARMRPMVGQGARALLERAMADQGVPATPDQLDAHTLAFIEHYRGAIAVHSRPFPGCVSALDQLAALGARLCVCTNKRTDLSVQLLSALGLADRFAAIVGADLPLRRKPDPVHFTTAIAMAGGALSHALMVGDSSADTRAASGAGRPSILVRFGYPDGPVETLGASMIIDDYAELAPACIKLLVQDHKA